MSRRSRPVGVDEAAARDVLLLQAFESVDPPSPSWTADDAAWATRAAREGEGAKPPAPRDVEAFLVARASLALRRLLPREPALAAVWPLRARHTRRLGIAVAVGAVVGLGADAIGSSQRINLLAPPVWTVVVWNLAVYLLLGVAAVRRALGRARGTPGLFVRAVERLAHAGRLPPERIGAAAAGSTAAALRIFATRWSAVAAPLAASRAVVLLHAAAAALGVGLVAGLYARGLVLDYRVAWESTFLAPADVHAALSTLLAPASRLSGIALPDVAAVAALRAAHGDSAVGAPAAPWIHLYAWTLAIAVVLPRAALAAFGAARVRRAASRVRLPLDDAALRRLDLERRGEVARVALHPYAQPPGPAALAGVRRVLVKVFGDGVLIDVAPTSAFGSEGDEGPVRAPSAGATVVVALFDLGATPEPEHQGRYLARLAASADAATVAMVDETAFRRRFRGDGRRVAERRAAWSTLLAAHGTVAVFTDLEAPDPAEAAGVLGRAVGSPVRLPG